MMITGFLRSIVTAVGVTLVMSWATPSLQAQGLSVIFYTNAMERGDLAAAETHLDRMIKEQPGNPALLAQRSYVRTQRANLKGALEDARKIVADYPRLPLGHAQMLHVMSVTATAAEHEALVRKATPFLERDGMGAITLATHLHFLGKPKEALEALDKAIEFYQQNGQERELPRTLAYRAILLYDDLRKDEALAALKEAQTKYPGDEEVEEVRLELLLAEGRLPEALEFFKRLFRQREKTSLNTWFDRAQARYLTGQYTKAREDLQEALRRSPIDSHSRIGIAAMWLLEGKPAEAEKFLDLNMTAILRDRATPRQSANSLLNMRQDQVTLEMLGISTINPYYNRALARAMNGKRKAAIEDATRAAKGDGQFAPYPPAEDLRQALISGATIKLDPQPLSLDELPKPPTTNQDNSTTAILRGLIETLKKP